MAELAHLPYIRISLLNPISTALTMDPNHILTKLQESNALLHEVLYDANTISDIIEQAEVRVAEANAKYAALRRFICAAITAELKREVRPHLFIYL